MSQSMPITTTSATASGLSSVPVSHSNPGITGGQQQQQIGPQMLDERTRWEFLAQKPLPQSAAQEEEAAIAAGRPFRSRTKSNALVGMIFGTSHGAFMASEGGFGRKDLGTVGGVPLMGPVFRLGEDYIPADTSGQRSYHSIPPSSKLMHNQPPLVSQPPMTTASPSHIHELPEQDRGLNRLPSGATGAAVGAGAGGIAGAALGAAGMQHHMSQRDRDYYDRNIPSQERQWRQARDPSLYGDRYDTQQQQQGNYGDRWNERERHGISDRSGGTGERYGDREDRWNERERYGDRYGGDRDRYGQYGDRSGQYGERWNDRDRYGGDKYGERSGERYGGDKYGERSAERYGERSGERSGERYGAGERYGDRYERGGVGSGYDRYGGVGRQGYDRYGGVSGNTDDYGMNWEQQDEGLSGYGRNREQSGGLTDAMWRRKQYSDSQRTTSPMAPSSGRGGVTGALENMVGGGGGRDRRFAGNLGSQQTRQTNVPITESIVGGWKDKGVI